MQVKVQRIQVFVKAMRIFQVVLAMVMISLITMLIPMIVMVRCKFEPAGQTGSLAKVDWYRSDIGKFSKVGRISEVIIRRRLKFGSMI